jgi:hypothetical protein
MPSAVSAAGPRDVSQVVEDLHAAFMEDPVLSWVFPDETKRRRYGHRYFEMAGSPGARTAAARSGPGRGPGASPRSRPSGSGRRPSAASAAAARRSPAA